MLSGRHCAAESCGHSLADGSIVPVSGESEDPGQTWEGILWAGDGARGARDGHGIRSAVHRACRGHEHFAAAIPNDEIQTVDAQCARAVVACTPAGIRGVRALVHVVWRVPRWLIRWSRWRRRFLL